MVWYILFTPGRALQGFDLSMASHTCPMRHILHHRQPFKARRTPATWSAPDPKAQGSCHSHLSPSTLAQAVEELLKKLQALQDEERELDELEDQMLPAEQF